MPSKKFSAFTAALLLILLIGTFLYTQITAPARIACPEEISFINKWITEEQLEVLAESLKKNSYGQYLLSLIN